MTSEEFRQHGHGLIDWIADYLDHSDRYPVLPRMKPGGLVDALPAQGPERGEPMEAILADFEKLIVPATTHWNHPGFMAYFGISASAPGVLGELLTRRAQWERHAVEVGAGSDGTGRGDAALAARVERSA